MFRSIVIGRRGKSIFVKLSDAQLKTRHLFPGWMADDRYTQDLRFTKIKRPSQMSAKPLSSPTELR